MAAAFRHGGGQGSLWSYPHLGLRRGAGGVPHGASTAVSATREAVGRWIYGVFAALTAAASAADKADVVTPSVCDTNHPFKWVQSALHDAGRP